MGGRGSATEAITHCLSMYVTELDKKLSSWNELVFHYGISVMDSGLTHWTATLVPKVKKS